MKVLIAVVSLAVSVSARMAFELPDGADLLLQGRSLDTTFSCLDRPYGYYADVDNDCAIFHVCQPITDADGELVETAHFSFICGNNTIFSQSSLTCATLDDAYPCSEARNIYDPSNSLFGVISDESRPIIFPEVSGRDDLVDEPEVLVPVVDPVIVTVPVVEPVVESVPVVAAFDSPDAGDAEETDAESA